MRRWGHSSSVVSAGMFSVAKTPWPNSQGATTRWGCLNKGLDDSLLIFYTTSSSKVSDHLLWHREGTLRFYKFYILRPSSQVNPVLGCCQIIFDKRWGKISSNLFCGSLAKAATPSRRYANNINSPLCGCFNFVVHPWFCWGYLPLNLP